MSLMTLGLLSGATLSATGGTALSLTPASGAASNQVYLSNASQEDFRLREIAQFKAQTPAKQRDGSFSKDRRNVSFTVPVYDPVSETYDNIVVRIERVAPAFATSAQVSAALNLAAQTMFDADTVAFWTSGSYA